MRYALLVCHDENAAISAQERSRRAGAFTSFQDEMSASGVLVGSERLHPTETASIVRAWDGGDGGGSDGPFPGTKGQVGGLPVVVGKELEQGIEAAVKASA